MAKPEPEPDPRLAERTQKLNVLFALAALSLLVATGVMVWADYDREWRQYQLEFGRLRVQHTKEQIEKALGPEDAQRLQEVDAQLQKGRDVARYEVDEPIHERSPRVDARREAVRRLKQEWERHRLDVEDVLARSDA